jgi:Flp pilus assembly pilin Flp
MKEVSEKMKKSLRRLYRRLQGRKGQSLVEYALILALIAVVAILVLQGIGKGVNNKLISVNANLQ